MGGQLLQRDKSPLVKYGRGSQESIFLKRIWPHPPRGGVGLPHSCLARLETGPWPSLVGKTEDERVCLVGTEGSFNERGNVSGASVRFGRTLSYFNDLFKFFNNLSELEVGYFPSDPGRGFLS